MTKQKNNKKMHWLYVVAIGIAFGFALQFVRAWTEPTAPPPGGNLGAPLNTSINNQVKGNATQGKLYAADFCLNSDPTKCLSNVGGGGGGTVVTAGTCTEVEIFLGAGTPTITCGTEINDFLSNLGWPTVSPAATPGICDGVHCSCAYGSAQVQGGPQYNHITWTGKYRYYSCQL